MTTDQPDRFPCPQPDCAMMCDAACIARVRTLDAEDDEPMLCGSRYPSVSRQSNTRIVRCDLAVGHDGDHMETDTESTWPRAEPVTPTPAEPALRYKDLTTEQQNLVETAMRAVDAYGIVCYQFGAGDEDDDPDTTPAFNAARATLVSLYARGIAEGRRQAAADVRAFAERRRVVMLADRTPERHAVMGAYGLAADVAATGLPPGSEQEEALARLVGPWEPAEQPGMCGAEAPSRVPGRHFGSCLLVKGHEGWHNAGGNAAWEPAEQPEPAPPVREDDPLSCGECYDIAHDELDERETCDEHAAEQPEGS